MASGSFYVNEDPLDDSSPVIIKSYIGLRAAEPIVKNKAIPLEVCYTNNSTSRYYGIVKLVLEHSDGTPIGDPLDIYDWGLAGGIPPSNYDLYLSNFPASTFTITQDFGFGDRLALYYTDDDSKSHFVRMGGAIDGSVIFELPVMPVPFIKVEDAYHPGDIFQFRLINYDKQYLGTKWTITDPDGVVSADLPQSQREFKFTKEGVYKIQAAIAEAAGDDAIENIVTYITVSNPMP